MSDLRERRDPRGAPQANDPNGGGGAGGAGDGRSVRVLILDEDRVEGGMLAFHLRREGLVVMLMTSVEEASDAIAWSAPDVVLVEVTGRGFDGHELVTRLAKMPIDVFAFADRPLELEDELEALRLGVIDILRKPLDPATLTRRLLNRPPRERRGSMPDLPENGISGDLGVHSVTWLLQMAHRHRMNARLHVEIDGDWGVLLVRHGEIIDAEAPSATGREAAFQAIRVERGAFVLFPFGPDAEELSRDDVVRADLATLVADALGRQEPRPVNPVREQQRETFVLPHVGSPRGPLSKRGGEETLEYVAQEPDPGRPVSARVKRPGEKAREQRQQNTGDARQGLMREPSGEMAAARAPRQQLVPRSQVTQDPTEAKTYVPVEAMKKALAKGDRDRSTTAATLDEVTDGLAGRVPAVGRGGGNDAVRGRYKDGDVEERRSGTDPMGRIVARPGDGDEDVRATLPNDARLPKAGDTIIQTPSSKKLRRIQRSQEVQATSSGAPVSRKPTDPELAAVAEPQVAPRPEPRSEPARPEPRPESRPDREASRPERERSRPPVSRPSPLTWVLTLLLVGVVAFVGYRLATREAPTAQVEDHETRFGKALLALDEGKRDAARSELAALVVAPEAPNGALSMLARIFYEDGRLAEAEALLARLSERLPRDPEVLSWLGLVQLERNDLVKAKETLEKARQVAPAGALSRQLEGLLKAQDKAPGVGPNPGPQ